MSTRSTARNLFPPLDNPELTIRRRSHSDPTLLNNSKMAAEGLGDLPVPDLRTMEELCQPSLNGQGGPISPIAIQTTNFGLKNDMIQQVQNSCQFHGLPAAGGTFMKRRPEECYNLIENMSAHHNNWDTSAQRSESFSSITSSFDTKITAVKAEMAKINKNLMRVLQVNQQVKGVTPNYETCGGPHSFSNCPATIGNTQNVYAVGAYQGTLLGNTITNPKEDLKGITTRNGTAYPGPIISTSSSSPVVKRKTEATKDTVHPTNNGSTKDVQPLVVRTESPILTSEPVISPIIEPVAFPIFKDLNFNISFAEALILMPKFSPSIKSLLTNKDKLCELAGTPLNEHCSTVLLNKLLEKLGDPVKFLILYDFPRMTKCLALADLGTCINLMPLSVWNKLYLPDFSPTCMTLELADRSISRSIGVTEDACVKVGTFHFQADFVVVDFNADPRVPLILGRSFLKTGRALIDLFEGELTLRVGKEAITFNLDQTSRYSSNYNDIMAKRINVIDMACEEYSQEVLDFYDVIASGNPTPYYDLIISTTSPTLTPFRNSDFLLEEVDSFLALEDDPTSPKELKIYEVKSDKSSIDEPSEVELKDLPPHLEYSFLEGDDKFPVIIAKDLSMEEKTALITDFKPAVQHQRRVNPKINDVIKQEVLKLLDARLIYPISDSPWVSPVHCVPKKGGFTVVENEENELILTRLVIGWRVCIDYRKLNEATRKDHFPLPFMDQMLERLAGNQYYCFLDGFSGYFQIPIDPKDQEKTTFTCPYGTFAYRRMPFGLCNASGTFQRCMMAIFHDMIEKTMEVFMDDFLVFGNSFQSCLSHLEKMLKSRGICLQEISVLSHHEQSIVYTDHSAIKYLFAKKDSKARLLCWVLLLQEFTFKVIDTKGVENLATDHLSRLENPHQNVLDPKEINEPLPLETLNLVSTCGNSSTPWFADFANYQARNFVVKGMSSQQKNKFFKDVKHCF
uniref:RNA-directed DNA polymerase n=1 Tax=Tanacetum cinerariifolium TaxID=118510 RepID=A0A6L2MVK7_TANCI|nr:reverse transcriptase domain-containing protein [Tanacetum cinerariifolium]